MNRNGQSQQQGRAATTPGAQTPQQQHVPSAPQHHDNDNGGNFKKSFSWSRVPGWVRVANVVLLFSITVLALSLVLLFRSSNPNEAKYITENKYQAVFLNNGQVYFGKVTAMNSKYFSLQNVFYLNSTTGNSSSDKTKTTDTSSNNFTLVKLGCELHGPYDQMVINRDQVTFWENLKDDGQVVKTINEWVKQNPSGQKCSTSTNSSSQSSSDSSTTQNAATSTTTGTSSNTTGGTATTNKNQ